MDPGEAGGLHRGEARGEFLVRLPWKPHDDVGGDGHPRHGGADAAQQREVPFRRVGAAHAAQGGGGAALEGEVEMAAEAAVLPEIEEPLVEIPGRDRGQAQAGNLRLVEDRADQVPQAAPLRSPGGDLHAGDHDLPVTPAEELPDLRHHLRRRPAPLGPAREGDDAEGAPHVAAVLHLDQRPRQADVRGAGDRDMLFRKRRVDEVDQAVLLRVGDHEVDSSQPGGLLGGAARVAAGEHRPDRPPGSPRSPRRLARLPGRGLGDRAGVDDVEVRLGERAHHLVAGRLEVPPQALDLRLVELAAEVGEVDAHGGDHSLRKFHPAIHRLLFTVWGPSR